MLLLLSGDIETNPGPHENSGEDSNLRVFPNVFTEPLISFFPRTWSSYKQGLSSVSFLVANEDPLLVLRRHWRVLLDCFQSSPTRLAGVLYEKRFISTDTRDRVTDTRGTETAEKAAILLAEVERVIGACSGMDHRRMRFQEFLRVVKDHPAVAGSQLKGMYETNSKTITFVGHS